MLKILIVISILFVGLPSWAVSTASCYWGGCFVRGFHQYQLEPRFDMSTDCIELDCAKNGWTTVMQWPDSRKTKVECKGDGCFVDGYIETNTFTRRVEQDVECVDRSCLTNGWISTARGRLAEHTRCTDGDCITKGWSVKKGDGTWRTTRCLDRDCEFTGWDEYAGLIGE